MHLRQLKVRFLPGIEQGFSVDDLGPGINVIVGPNGSGKSSLRRLATSMLWPDLRASAETRARATWDTRQGTQQVDVGTRIAWQRDGVDVASPDVPDVHLSSCYAVDLRDLLSMSGEGDQRLAARLRIELSAGYDLRALRDQGRHRPKGRKEEGRLNASRRELAVLRRERERLATQEDNLVALCRRRDELRHLTRMKSVYDDAIAYVETVNALREAQAAYDLFPSEMARVRGDEPQSALQVEHDIESDSTHLRQQESLLLRAQEESVTSRISADQMDSTGLQAAQLRLRELREAAQALRHSKDALERLTARREDAACALGIV
ncbi:MAG: hypothetical protein O3C57_05255, partial [Verrucomicrobia bacterium]|nr:hypothetical protein [Verrucomicrobiota bacterium]